MRIALAASPLPGLRASAVCDVAREAWLSERPWDSLRCRPASDGVASAYSESGVYELLGLDELVERGGPLRRFAGVSERKVALDWIESLPGPFCGDSAALGEDIAWALGRGVDEIVVALGVPGGIGDLGVGMIRAIAQTRRGAGPESGSRRAGGSRQADGAAGLAKTAERPDVAEAADVVGLAGLVADARAALGTVCLSVVVGGRQRLMGMSGLARAWMREGLDGRRAQDAERRVGEAADRLVRATNATPGKDLAGRRLSTRGPHSGAGGGLALGLEALGGRIVPVGDVVHSSLEGWAEGADLCVYVCGQVGEELPGGAAGAIRRAQEAGLPVVLVYDCGALRRGELAGLGLNGAYEMRPERSFLDEPETPESAAAVGDRLGDAIRAVARTWGWRRPSE